MRKGQYIDITGQRFGRLVAVEISPRGQGTRTMWKCKCDCGNTTVASISNLRNGHTQSCGCLQISRVSEALRTHGHKGAQSVDRLYPVWRAMKQRCFLRTSKAYKYYGGRGITVCDAWMKYENFMEWAYTHGYDHNASRGKCTIDRIDVNGNYDPSNCRFVDMVVQNNNKRNSRCRKTEGDNETVSDTEAG